MRANILLLSSLSDTPRGAARNMRYERDIPPTHEPRSCAAIMTRDAKATVAHIKPPDVCRPSADDVIVPFRCTTHYYFADATAARNRIVRASSDMSLIFALLSLSDFATKPAAEEQICAVTTRFISNAVEIGYVRRRQRARVAYAKRGAAIPASAAACYVLRTMPAAPCKISFRYAARCTQKKTLCKRAQETARGTATCKMRLLQIVRVQPQTREGVKRAA